MQQRGPQGPVCPFDQVPPPGSKRSQAEAISTSRRLDTCSDWRVEQWVSSTGPTDKDRRREHPSSPQPCRHRAWPQDEVRRYFLDPPLDPGLPFCRRRSSSRLRLLLLRILRLAVRVVRPRHIAPPSLGDSPV